MYKSEHMTGTGIPPFVCLFMQIADIPAKVKDMLVEALREVRVLPRAEESEIMRSVLAKLSSIETRMTAQAPSEAAVPRRDTAQKEFHDYL